MTYQEFLQSKVPPSHDSGFDVLPGEVHPLLKPHQRDIVCWAVKKGRAAIFAAFGLGKSLMQLECARLVLQKVAESRRQNDLFPFCRFLIVAPLGVRQEFKRDAAMIGLDIKFVRRIEECEETGIYLTNYETIRDGKLDPRQFTGVSLDEAGILRGFGGTKTFRKFMQLFEGTSIYRFVATATPSPNEFIELLAYAGFLDVMDIGQAKTRFFKRDSTKADVWTDITRMLTLNGAQSAAGREMHLCPMQFDLADRVIAQFSMKGEVVFDPFAGLGTVPLRAVKLGRYGHGIELSSSYFQESIRYLQAAENQARTPCLFDMDVLSEEEIPEEVG